MKKKDLIDKSNEVYAKLEDIKRNAETLSEEIGDCIRLMDSLPTDPDEIDPDEPEEEKEEEEEVISEDSEQRN